MDFTFFTLNIPGHGCFLIRISPYKDRIFDSVHERENTSQNKPILAYFKQCIYEDHIKQIFRPSSTKVFFQQFWNHLFLFI